MDIAHDPAAQRFVSHLDGGTAVLSYELRDDGILDLYSTFVPQTGRGRGVAAALVQAAMAYARAEGYRVIPSCSYVTAWLEEHPEQADLRAP